MIKLEQNKQINKNTQLKMTQRNYEDYKILLKNKSSKINVLKQELDELVLKENEVSKHFIKYLIYKIKDVSFKKGFYLRRTIPKNTYTLSQFMKNNQKLDITNKMKIMEAIWSALNKVFHHHINMKWIKIVSLDPSNLYIRIEKDEKDEDQYIIMFGDYLPRLMTKIQSIEKVNFETKTSEKIPLQNLPFNNLEYFRFVSRRLIIEKYEKTTENKCKYIDQIQNITKTQELFKKSLKNMTGDVKDLFNAYGLLLLYLMDQNTINGITIRNNNETINLHFKGQWFENIINKMTNPLQRDKYYADLESHFVSNLGNFLNSVMKYLDDKNNEDFQNDEFIKRIKKNIKPKVFPYNSQSFSKSIPISGYQNCQFIVCSQGNTQLLIQQCRKDRDNLSEIINSTLQSFIINSIAEGQFVLKPKSVYFSQYDFNQSIKKQINQSPIDEKLIEYSFIEYDIQNRKIQTLLDYCSSFKPYQNVSFIEHIFIELLMGLWNLHGSKAIIHRKLHPKTILVVENATNPKYPTVLLMDFVNAKYVSSTQTRAATKFDNENLYSAPEICKQIKDNNNENNECKKYTYKADLFSLGRIMYAMILFLGEFFEFYSSDYVDQNHNNAFMKNDQSLITNFESKVSNRWEYYPELKRVLDNMMKMDKMDVNNQEERWGWHELFRDDYIQYLLLNRWRRIVRENPSLIYSSEEKQNGITEKDIENKAIELWEKENEERDFSKLAHLANYFELYEVKHL